MADSKPGTRGRSHTLESAAPKKAAKKTAPKKAAAVKE